MEWLLAAWLLAAVLPRLAWVAVWTILAVFTGVLLYARSTGIEQSCGCLGMGGLDLMYSIVRNSILMAVCILGLVFESCTAKRLQIEENQT